MSEHGATLQTYNQELVKCEKLNSLESLRTKKNQIQEVITKEETEKRAIEKDISSLQEKLHIIEGSLQKHKSLYENYKRAICDTESGFRKIVESSQALLTLAQTEASKLHNYKRSRSQGSSSDSPDNRAFS